MESSDARVRSLAIVTRSVSFEDGIGGFERAISEQAHQLALLGWQITVLAPSRFVRGRVPHNFVDVPWPRWGAAPGRPGFGVAYTSWARRVRRTIEALPPYHTIYLHGGAAGALPLKQHQSRVVLNPHGMEEFARADLLRWSNRVFLRRLARRGRIADRVLATDAALVPMVVRNIGVPEGRVSLAFNGVDVNALCELASSGKDSAIAADVISIGRLTKNKGYDLLLEALGSVADSMTPPGAQLKWVHFGSGAQEATLKAAAARFKSIDFHNVQDASDEVVQASLKASRLFVQPSRYEGSSLTTLEAMTHGIVCVGTPVGGIPEKIRDGETGFLASSATASALADAIVRAWGRSADSSLGKNAAQFVRERYDIPKISQQLSEVLAGD